MLTITEEQIKDLSPEDKARALVILQELELTEYQRYRNAAIQQFKEFMVKCAEEGCPVSYRDMLMEAKKNLDRKRAEDPNYKSTLQRLMEAPDEVARQARIAARIKDERERNLAIHGREALELEQAINEDVARHEQPAERPVVEAIPSRLAPNERPAEQQSQAQDRPSKRPKFDNVMDALTAPRREPRCLNDESADYSRIERW
jgi:hypothetical protein